MITFRRSWTAWLFAIFLALTLLAQFSLTTRKSIRESHYLFTRHHSLEENLTPTMPASKALRTNQSEHDFSALPSILDGQAALATIRQSAAGAHVTFRSVEVRHRPDAPGRLILMDLGVSMGGSYPDIKQTLINVQRRLPGITISTLKLNRTSAEPTVDATIVFSLWAASASTPAGRPIDAGGR